MKTSDGWSQELKNRQRKEGAKNSRTGWKDLNVLRRRRETPAGLLVLREDAAAAVQGHRPQSRHTIWPQQKTQRSRAPARPVDEGRHRMAEAITKEATTGRNFHDRRGRTGGVGETHSRPRIAIHADCGKIRARHVRFPTWKTLASPIPICWRRNFHLFPNKQG